MMYTRYINALEYGARVIPELMKNEVEHNLPIGIIDRDAGSPESDNWFMSVIESESGTAKLIAMMTPPHNLILASPELDVPDDALQLLANSIIAEGVRLPGIIGDKALALAFAWLYTAKCGLTVRVKDERLYRLDTAEDVPLVGSLRPASEGDMHYLPYWIKGFEDDCFGAVNQLSAESALRSIRGERLFILEADDMPVSLVGTARKTPHGSVVGPVYTPPYLRGRGYATAAVAMLSRSLLERGNEYCLLFTDLANPTSNSIYQQIGYKPIRDFAELRFERS